MKSTRRRYLKRVSHVRENNDPASAPTRGRCLDNWMRVIGRNGGKMVSASYPYLLLRFDYDVTSTRVYKIAISNDLTCSLNFHYFTSFKDVLVLTF